MSPEHIDPSSVPSDAFDHPLVLLVKQYCDLYERIREDNIELSNEAFYSRFGCSLSGPEDWPYLSAIKYAVEHFKNVAIVYVDARDHTVLTDVLGTKQHVTFLSWHEVYYQIDSNDIMFEGLLKDVSLFMIVRLHGGPIDDYRVINFVRNHFSGCLIEIG